ncbi:MAG: aminoglycoside phosphotransferase family protein, partial [Deltaproteobacteria bacterium]|nr:aminoglycoside phosphotransferase family protein [Kofleriaceae bacterium]
VDAGEEVGVRHRVERLDAGGQCFVRKHVPTASWRQPGMGRSDGGEPALWVHGAVRSLGPRVRWPVVDVAWDAEGDAYVMLMDDVAPGIRGRGAFSRADSHAFFGALADMHARFMGGAALADAPLPDVTGTIRVFTAPLLHLVGRRPSDEPWVTAMLDDFQVMRHFAPRFLELLGPTRADDYLALCDDDVWPQRLAHHPATLLHGDPRRANISFDGDGDGVALFDWELAAVGPPACDLQWHCFLNYWAYPPEGSAAGDPCDDLRDHYVAALEAQLGRGIDRAAFLESWGLGWLKSMVTIGCVLADGATAETAVRAVERALEARAALR